MKIIILINSSWNIINFRSNLVKRLINEGHQVVAMTTDDKYSHLLKDMGCEFINVSFKSKSINPFTELKLLFSIFNQIKNIRPDFLLTFTIKPNIYGSLVAMTLGIKTINNIAGLGIAHSNFFLRNLVKYLYKISLLNTSKCFFQNEDDLSYFIDNNIVKSSKTSLLPGSGVDLNKFCIDEEFISLNANNNDNDNFIFLLSSRLLWSKGIKEYVEAAKLIRKDYKNVDFWLVGFTNVDNNDSIDLEVIKSWNDKGFINFKGSTDNIKSILKTVDCFVLPSYYPEGTPKSLLEAASMQLPIITTDTPGCRNVVIEKNTGYLCKPKDHLDLSKKMKLILDLNKDERKKMGELARELMEIKFDDDIVNNQYLVTIKNLATSH